VPPKDDRITVLRKRVATAPAEPGIYRWLDATGRILYVGKAKNLRNRLRSYVAPVKKSDGPWKQSFKEQIVDFDVTVTETDLEALLLETNLIKQLKPKYNVLMKDDKNYLFVRIAVEDPYPKIETVRRFEQDGAKYFGPFLNGYELRETMTMLHEAIGYRACAQSIEALNKKGEEGRAQLRPCLEHQIGRCNGLCAGTISADEYLRRIELVIGYLNGKKDTIRSIVEQKMKNAAAEKKFEIAAKFRNYLLLIEGKAERQIATDTTGESSDIFGVAILSNRAHVVVMHRRDGRLIGEAHFALHGQAEDVGSVLEQFLPQFYDDGQEVPESILLPDTIEDLKALAELLKERRGRTVKLIVPERGRKSHLLQLAEKNALVKAKQVELKWEAENKNIESALGQLKKLLNLPTLPKRIEGYDISHLGGTETVGSMVVTKDGKAANAEYRSFTIRTLKAGEIDDYKAIREVLNRRLRHVCGGIKEETALWKKNGVEIRKARKADQTFIQETRERAGLETDEAAYKETIVATHDGAIVGMARLQKAPGCMVIRSMWLAEDHREGRLGHLVLRTLLKSVKRGKVYVICEPSEEDYYVQIGFRYVINPPPTLVTWMSETKTMEPMPSSALFMLWEASQNKIDKSLTARPDLIVIDGGKGQLNAALEALKAWKIEIPVIGLAKREEEIFVPGDSFPIPFPADSPAKFLLMRLRDEAHRFSNRHRENRLKNVAKASALDEVPGIGDETRTHLLRKFGSLSSIVSASDEELLTILTTKQLEEIRKHLA
jgi:excinuclease ABC subunit C